MKEKLPTYHAINDFLATVASGIISRNPNFYCLRLSPFDDNIVQYKPPFKKGFYFIALIFNSGETAILHDEVLETHMHHYLVLQSHQ